MNHPPISPSRMATKESMSAEIIGTFPLAPAQEGVWMTERLAPGSSAYNLAEAWQLEGPLDPSHLHESLNYLVRRHEALRTVISTTCERAQQVVQQPRPFHLEFKEITGIGLVTDLAFEARKPFDLYNGPLARGTLFRLASEEHVLLL